MECRKSILENGLRVVTLTVPTARSVTLGLLVEAGVASEPTEHPGLAHLLEHMIFQGSSHRDALEMARLMDGAGGRIGGFTSRDYTCYFAQVLAEFVPYAIDLLGDAILNPVFPEDALEREKHAIRCEREASQDNPEHRAHAAMRSAMWPDHALGRPILGDADRLEDIGREDLIYFLHSHYQPDRMVIAAAGNLIHEDFVAQVRDAFWRLLGCREAAPADPPVTRPALVLEPAPVSQAYFSLGIEAPAFASVDRYRAHVLDQILGAGISSRLFGTLRERHGLVYHVASAYEAWRDAGLLTIEGSTTGDHLSTSIGLVVEELSGLLHGELPVQAEELHRAKIRLRSQIQLAAEDTHALMSRLATHELYFGRHMSENEMLSGIEGIDIDDLRYWIEHRLAPAFANAALAIVGPVEDSHESLSGILHDAFSRQRKTDALPSSIDAHDHEERTHGTQAANQEELDRDPEAPRRAGQRHRCENRSQGRKDAQRVAPGRHRRLRQTIAPTSSEIMSDLIVEASR